MSTTSTSRFSRSVERGSLVRPLLVSAAVACSLLAACHAFHVCRGDSCAGIESAGSASGGNTGAAGKATQDGGRSMGSDSAGAGAAGPPAGHTAGGGDGDGSDGGRAGQAGEASVTDCEPPHADCDESTLTGCETNLLTDVAHCGACGAYCHGICAAGQCQAFESLSFDGPMPLDHGIAVVPNSVQTELYALGSDLLRWSEKTGVTTIVQSPPKLRGILAGSDRLYALTDAPDFRVWSLPFGGGALTTTGLTARSAIWKSSWYAVAADGVPYHVDAEGARHDLPLPSAEPAPTRFRWGNWLLVSSRDEADASGYSYRAYELQTSESVESWKLLGRGSGLVNQVNDDLLDVILNAEEIESAEPDDAGFVHELRALREDGATETLIQLRGVVSFTVYGSVAYVSRRLPDERRLAAVLTLVPLDAPEQSADYATDAVMTSLTTAGDYFYFGTRFGLMRLRPWL